MLPSMTGTIPVTAVVEIGTKKPKLQGTMMLSCVIVHHYEIRIFRFP